MLKTKNIISYGNVPENTITSHDLAPPTALYGKTKKERIYQKLKAGITAGTYPPDSYFPAARALAEQFQTSITPVYQAIDMLEADGLVETLAGYGTRILTTQNQPGKSHRPLVEVITTLKSLSEHPRFKHHLPAVQEQLILRLREHAGLRISLATLDDTSRSYVGEEGLRSILSECLHLRPKVLVFSEPEDFSNDIEQILHRLQQNGTAIVYRASRKDCPAFDRVHSAFDQGQADLTNHLWQTGYHQLLRVCISRQPFYEQQKSIGFRRALSQMNLDDSTAESWTWELGDSFLQKKPHDRVTHLIGLLTVELRNRPVTAIMAPDDPLVAPFRIALDYMNRRNLIVAGYDDLWEEAVGGILYDYPNDLKDLNPPLSVDTCLPAVGEKMAEMTVARALQQTPKEPQLGIVDQKVITHEPASQK